MRYLRPGHSIRITEPEHGVLMVQLVDPTRERARTIKLEPRIPEDDLSSMLIRLPATVHHLLQEKK